MKKIKRVFSHDDSVRPQKQKFFSLRQRISVLNFIYLDFPAMLTDRPRSRHSFIKKKAIIFIFLSKGIFEGNSVLSVAQTSNVITQTRNEEQACQDICQTQDEDQDDLINSSIMPPPMIVLKQEQAEQVNIKFNNLK